MIVVAAIGFVFEEAGGHAGELHENSRAEQNDGRAFDPLRTFFEYWAESQAEQHHRGQHVTRTDTVAAFPLRVARKKEQIRDGPDGGQNRESAPTIPQLA